MHHLASPPAYAELLDIDEVQANPEKYYRGLKTASWAPNPFWPEMELVPLCGRDGIPHPTIKTWQKKKPLWQEPPSVGDIEYYSDL